MRNRSNWLCVGRLYLRGFPGAISDPIETEVSHILESIPFGMAVEVDRGLIIDNLCCFIFFVSSQMILQCIRHF